MNAGLEDIRFSVADDDSQDLYVLRFQPPFSFHQIEQAERALTNRADYQRTFFRLYDFSECVGIQLTTTALFAIVREASDWKLDRSARIAFVAGSQADAGLLRIYASSVPDRSMQVFLGESEARRWLQVDNPNNQAEPNMLLACQVIQLRGTISVDQVLEAQKRLRDDPEFSATQPVLWDLRDAQFQESIGEVEKVAAFVAGNHLRDRPGARSAVLIDSHLMGLYLQALMKAAEWPEDDVRVFRSYREALAWLGHTYS